MGWKCGTECSSPARWPCPSPPSAAARAQDADQIAEGEKVFKRCAACHQVGEGRREQGRARTRRRDRPHRRHRAGLQVLRRDDRVRRGGQRLELRDPARLPREPEGDWCKGTKMAFAGLKKPEDRDAVIAYIEAAAGHELTAGPERRPAAPAISKRGRGAVYRPRHEPQPARPAPRPRARRRASTRPRARASRASAWSASAAPRRWSTASAS